MSETEKKKRASYRKKRKIWIGVLTTQVIAVALLTAFFATMLFRLNKTLYVDYTETSNVNYTVDLKPNDFYEKEQLGPNQAYVASLVESITADFTYALDTEAENVNYEYSYKIDTQLEIVDNSSKVAIFNPIYENKPLQSAAQNSSNRLEIKEQVTLDYTTYNELAKRFLDTYELADTTCTLILRMHVKVLSVCDDFAQNSQNEHVVALHIPLTDKTVNIEMTKTVPTAESKILACSKDMNKAFFEKGVILSASADILLLITLFLFVVLTRNKDINYSLKVKRLLAAYRSYIQKINNDFDPSPYQVLEISTFNELLEIRDTINAPILMHENEDMTCTRFFIPTATKFLYLFEIKVEDYDEIYGITAPLSCDTPELTAQEPVEEQALTVETAAQEAVVQNAESTEGNGAYEFGLKYDYSFEAKLCLASDEVKGFYREIVTFARAYGVKVVRSWARERIYLGRNLFALITFKGKKLALAFALDPKTADPKYHAFDMSETKKFERTPMLMRITSPRKVKFALNLLTDMFAGAGIENKNLTVTADTIPHKSKEQLMQENLIKFKQ